MPLPDSWADALLAKLTLRYGAAFLRQWPDVKPEHVKGDWADVLDGQSGAAIAHALQNLPSTPPNALQFRDLCRLASRDERQAAPLALPAPKADPARVAALLAGVARGTQQDPKAWAWRLREREAAEKVNDPGPRHRMTQFQREAWRDALRLELRADAEESSEVCA